MLDWIKRIYEHPVTNAQQLTVMVTDWDSGIYGVAAPVPILECPVAVLERADTQEGWDDPFLAPLRQEAIADMRRKAGLALSLIVQLDHMDAEVVK